MLRAHLTRRLTLAGLASLPAFAASAQGGAKLKGAFDPASPVDNLDALVRILGATDGSLSYWYATGRVYAVVPGEVAKPMFEAKAAQWIRFKAQADGTYAQDAAFVQYHYGLKGQPVASVVNPVTGAPIKVPDLRSGAALSQFVFSVTGIQRGSMGNHDSDNPGAPKTYDWKIDGDDAVMTQEAMSAYQAPWMPRKAVENSIRFYKTSTKALNDRTLARVPGLRFESSQTEFMPWLDMPAGQAGHMLWSMTASKHVARNEIPADLLKDIAARDPAFWPSS